MLKANQILILIATRILVVFSFLVSALVIQFITEQTLFLDPLFNLGAFTFFLTLIYLAVYTLKPRWRENTLYVGAQIIGDSILVSSLVGLTGGLTSVFSPLYLLVIILGGYFLGRLGTYLAGYSSLLLYLSTVAILQFPPTWLPRLPIQRASDLPIERFYFYLFVHILGFALVTQLVSLIVNRQQVVREALAKTQVNLDTLRVLHRNILESLDSGLASVDLNGNITFHNPRWQEILNEINQETHEYQGFSMGAINPLGENTEEILNSPARVTIESRNPMGKHPVWLGLSSTPLFDGQGAPRGTLVQLQDITERKSLETELQLQQSLHTVGSMSAGLAHEIRNPLASISGCVQMLATNEDTPEKSRNLLGIIKEESDRLHIFLTDFLNLSRPQEYRPEMVSLFPLLEDMLALAAFQKDMPEGTTVDNQIPSDLIVWADPAQLKQVFWNLIQNAMKAIVETTGMITLSANKEDPWVEIIVADNGVGMDSELLEKFFQPFSGGFHQGMGLGGAIVYQIIRGHQGKVEVESSPNQGTKVILHLPVPPHSVTESG